jgi:hypothetical protein
MLTSLLSRFALVPLYMIPPSGDGYWRSARAQPVTPTYLLLVS